MNIFSVKADYRFAIFWPIGQLFRFALQSNPLTNAILTLPKIREMVDEMFISNQGYVKDWR